LSLLEVLDDISFQVRSQIDASVDDVADEC
jgi:hypothetical protein